MSLVGGYRVGDSVAQAAVGNGNIEEPGGAPALNPQKRSRARSGQVQATSGLNQSLDGPGRHLAIGPCHITATRSLAPRSVELDAGVRVTTSVAATCRDPRPLHLVLLVDASSDMSDAHLDAVQSALISGVEALTPQGDVA